MCPVAQTDGHDFPRLADEMVPGLAAMVEEIVVGGEDAVRQPVLADELPDVFDRVQFRAFRRERHERDCRRHDKTIGQMPSGLIEQEHGVFAGSDLGRDLGQVQVHRLGIAARQDERCALPVARADGAEDIGRCGSLIPRSARASAALGPPAGDLVLLADASLVLEPNFYLADVDCFFARDFIQARWELFLKSSMAPSAWA